MPSIRLLSALAAATLLSMASAQSASSTVVSIQTPSTTLPANAMSTIGCFKDPEPLEDHGAYKFQSPGNCQLICLELDKPVLGVSDGTNCWCGDLIPALDAQVSNSSCDTTCSGTKDVLCGGPSMVWVLLSGLTANRISNFEPSSAKASKTSAPVAQSTEIANTVVVTATDSATSQSGKSSGPNKAGIAAGVVVGVIVLAAIIAGVFFFLRHKRRREVEEEYRRQAAVSSFVSGGKLHTSNSSMTDSRLDPEFMNRRASNGSIADNEDYSRRILKVTNA